MDPRKDAAVVSDCDLILGGFEVLILVVCPPVDFDANEDEITADDSCWC